MKQPQVVYFCLYGGAPGLCPYVHPAFTSDPDGYAKTVRMKQRTGAWTTGATLIAAIPVYGPWARKTAKRMKDRLMRKFERAGFATAEREHVLIQYSRALAFFRDERDYREAFNARSQWRKRRNTKIGFVSLPV